MKYLGDCNLQLRLENDGQPKIWVDIAGLKFDGQEFERLEFDRLENESQRCLRQ